LQWLPEAWYNKGCMHRLVNSCKGCARIVISMSVYLSVCLSAIISPKLQVWSLPNFWCTPRSWLDFPPAKRAKSAIYDCLVIVMNWTNCLCGWRRSLSITPHVEYCSSAWSPLYKKVELIEKIQHKFSKIV